MKRFLYLGSVKRFSNEKHVCVSVFIKSLHIQILSFIRQRIKPTVVVHGGAGDIVDDVIEDKKEGVKVAASIGYDVLLESGSVVNAVHESVRILELYSCLNDERDSAFIMDDTMELEAAIMNGSNMKCGAVSGVLNILHPISLARLVMEKTQHKHLSGEKAMRFAIENGFYIQTKETQDTADIFLDTEPYINTVPITCGTKGFPVGSVAIDIHGNIAAASSGGNIGAGIYADNLCGGVSVSSLGEVIKNHKTASRILAMIQFHELSAEDAVKKVLLSLKKRFKRTAGAICIDANGNIGVHCTTNFMPWAYRQDDEIHSGLKPDEYEVSFMEF